MKESFLEYTKYILERVSFDLELVKKEYQKALKLLEREEVRLLNAWMMTKGYQVKTVPV
tara:strand:- start:38890 stop:39066 length:177 start_codon:yes stop_codon:yes gene_type:complete